MQENFVQINYRRLMGRVRSFLFLAVVYVRDLRDERPNTPPEGFVARFIEQDELLELCRNPELDISRDFAKKAFLRNDICTGMFHHGKLVAYMWRSTSIAPHSHGICVETMKPYRYGYKALTLREYRGRHIPEYLAPIAGAHYMDLGYTHSIGFVQTHNYASRKSEERRGSKRVGYAGYFSILSFKFPFRTSGVRKTGFRFVKSP